MSIPHSLARYLSAAAAACSILAAAAPTQAAVIASFDPVFGPAIPNLGFRGTITLDVASGCYSLGTGFHATGGSCQITAQAAEVDFYNATQAPGTTLTSVTLGASSFALSYVYGAYFDPLTGQLAGIDTNDSNIFNVSVTDTNPLAPISYSGQMVLFFQTAIPQPGSILAMDAIASASIPGVGGAYLRNCTGTSGNACVSNQANKSAPAGLTFTTVPEPDSVGLALLGLGALVIARRRALDASARHA